MNKILIAGATGKLGSRVIFHLLKKIPRQRIVALVKDDRKTVELRSAGIEVRYGHYDDQASLDTAMKDISSVLLVSGTDLKRRSEQHRNVINAAKANGVEFIAYTSISIKDMHTPHINALTRSHFETEEYLRASGIRYGILRNTLYADDLPYYIGRKDAFLKQGILFNAGTGGVPFVLREEMAEGSANLLVEKNNESRVYEIGNRQVFSFDEIAEQLSILTKRQILYTDNAPEQQAEMLERMGIPKHIVTLVVNTGEDIKNGQFGTATGDLEELLGRKPAMLTRILKKVFVL